MKKRKVRQIPNLPRPVVGWIYNHARKNFWRVASWYEIDDLIQDGLLCAYKCLNKYGRPGIDIDEPHFMALVQKAFFNHIAQMLRYSRAINEDKIADLAKGLSETDIVDKIIKSMDNEQEFVTLIKELPEPLRDVVVLYLTDEGAKELRKQPRSKLYGANETFADRLQKLTGFSSRLDFETELRAHLWEREMDLVEAVEKIDCFECFGFGGWFFGKTGKRIFPDFKQHKAYLKHSRWIECPECSIA